MLYPVTNDIRTTISLDGLWKFKFDPQASGCAEGWQNGLKDALTMPVPASFSDIFTSKEERDYSGDFWYEKEFCVPAEWTQRVLVRFGGVAHRCTVYCNGVQVAEHEGGFLPVSADLTDAVRVGGKNILCVKVNNELSESTLPCGTVKTLKNGKKLVKPYFDFFNYSGIQRSVLLVHVPDQAIEDYEVSFRLCGKDAEVHYSVKAAGSYTAEVTLKDQDGNTAACAQGNTGVMKVEDAHLWRVRNAYLYQIEIILKDGEKVIDRYTDRIGIRTVEIRDGKILLNGEPVYLKGYGKHEDADILGRGFSWAVAKRDFECMKWTNANCFRTSHYPYADEWYQLADEEGFLIIDEVPAVGMMRSLVNFADAGSGKYTYFFEGPNVPELKKNHLAQTAEMIARDKNHPSVIAWSLFNEPETTSSFAKDYFTDIFAYARTADPQNRPLTGALEKSSSPDLCQCYQLCDFICLNRYYGWYINGGAEISDAEEEFREEMDQWASKKLNVPFVFTEFGTDTLASEHKLPAVMWTQEYQNEYMEMNFSVFDAYDFVQGELVWNFADFQTSEGIMRVNGNKKGVFTRQRQPKVAAFSLKKRWETKNSK